MKYIIFDKSKYSKEIKKVIDSVTDENKGLLNLGKITDYRCNCFILRGIDKANTILNKSIKKSQK